MSYTVSVFLQCDGPDCNAEFGAYLGHTDSLYLQRREARTEGWKVGQSGGKDFCSAECRAAYRKSGKVR